MIPNMLSVPSTHFTNYIQDKKVQKEAERQQVKEQIKDSQTGPSLREVEMDRISAKLTAIGCAIKPILADGNCLYRCALFTFQ